jgi:hypothetical protein
MAEENANSMAVLRAAKHGMRVETKRLARSQREEWLASEDTGWGSIRTEAGHLACLTEKQPVELAPAHSGTSVVRSNRAQSPSTVSL